MLQIQLGNIRVTQAINKTALNCENAKVDWTHKLTLIKMQITVKDFT